MTFGKISFVSKNNIIDTERLIENCSEHAAISCLKARKVEFAFLYMKVVHPTRMVFNSAVIRRKCNFTPLKVKLKPR